MLQSPTYKFTCVLKDGTVGQFSNTVSLPIFSDHIWPLELSFENFVSLLLFFGLIFPPGHLNLLVESY